MLLSGLKAKNQISTPFRLKTAVVNSAKQVDDPLNVGFIQVDQAWEYLQKFDERKDLDMLFQVLCNVSRAESVSISISLTFYFRHDWQDMVDNAVFICVNKRRLT